MAAIEGSDGCGGRKAGGGGFVLECRDGIRVVVLIFPSHPYLGISHFTISMLMMMSDFVFVFCIILEGSCYISSLMQVWKELATTSMALM